VFGGTSLLEQPLKDSGYGRQLTGGSGLYCAAASLRGEKEELAPGGGASNGQRQQNGQPTLTFQPSTLPVPVLTCPTAHWTSPAPPSLQQTNSTPTVESTPAKVHHPVAGVRMMVTPLNQNPKSHPDSTGPVP
jgi:hypothetical protein